MLTRDEVQTVKGDKRLYIERMSCISLCEAGSDEIG